MSYEAAIKQFWKNPWLIAKVEEGSTPHPAGQQVLRQTGFLAQTGMTDEDIDRFVETIYEERSHQHPREVDFS